MSGKGTTNSNIAQFQKLPLRLDRRRFDPGDNRQESRATMLSLCLLDWLHEAKINCYCDDFEACGL
jgi:hypothetical protein